MNWFRLITYVRGTHHNILVFCWKFPLHLFVQIISYHMLYIIMYTRMLFFFFSLLFSEICFMDFSFLSYIHIYQMYEEFYFFSLSFCFSFFHVVIWNFTFVFILYWIVHLMAFSLWFSSYILLFSCFRERERYVGIN